MRKIVRAVPIDQQPRSRTQPVGLLLHVSTSGTGSRANMETSDTMLPGGPIAGPGRSAADHNVLKRVV